MIDDTLIKSITSLLKLIAHTYKSHKQLTIPLRLSVHRQDCQFQIFYYHISYIYGSQTGHHAWLKDFQKMRLQRYTKLNI
jgi:hypothetical protein